MAFREPQALSSDLVTQPALAFRLVTSCVCSMYGRLTSYATITHVW